VTLKALSSGARRVATTGEGRWTAPPPEGEFSYLDLHLDRITYNDRIPAAGSADTAAPSRPHPNEVNHVPTH